MALQLDQLCCESTVVTIATFSVKFQRNIRCYSPVPNCRVFDSCFWRIIVKIWQFLSLKCAKKHDTFCNKLYIIEEHLKCEYTLSRDGTLAYLKGQVPLEEPDPVTPPRPVLRRKRSDVSTDTKPAKQQVLLKRKYQILPRSPEHDA